MKWVQRPAPWQALWQSAAVGVGGEVRLGRGQLVMLATRLDTHWYLGRLTGGSGQERMGLVPGNDQ